MVKITGGRAFCKSLESQGVSYIFGTPGTTEVPIIDTLTEYENLQYILTLHEGTALGMADGYARASKKPGVVSVHTIVGVGNTINYLYNSYRDRIPIVLTAGFKDTRLLGQGVFLETPDLPEIVQQFVKWSWLVLRADTIPEVMARAFKIATTPPEGPVFIAIPEDLQREEVEIELLPSHRFRIPGGIRPAEIQIEQAAQLLMQSINPIVIAGNEVNRAEALDELGELVELLSLPVFNEDIMSLCYLNFPNQHPLYQGPFSSTNPLVQSADLIFGVGCKMFMSFRYSPVPPFPTTARVIHLHIDPKEIAQIYPVDIAMVGDIKAALKDLLTSVKAAMATKGLPDLYRERRERLTQAKGKPPAQPSSLEATGDITPKGLVTTLGEILPEKAILVNEGIMTSLTLPHILRLQPSQGYYANSGGGLGWGVPAAMGIKLIEKDRPIVVLVGDGSLIFGIQSLWTAAHYQIPIIILVCNNRGYQAIKAALLGYGGKAAEEKTFLGCEITQPEIDFVQISKGFGVPGLSINRLEELKPAFNQALEAQTPYLIDISLTGDIPPLP
jgi:benzoylformate decarboxylase